jgi:hypothetical protein
MRKDYNIKKLKELYSALLDSNYKIYRVMDYLSEKPTEGKCVVLRHDVDFKPIYALRLAELEKEMGLRSTYYFRYVDEVFEPEIMKKIEQMGHEVGYHYETLNKCDGNIDEAYQLFLKELAILKKNFKIKTISPHGTPLDRHYSSYTFSGLAKLGFAYIRGKKVFTDWKNQNIWDNHDIKNVDIIGDAYLNFDFNKIHYFSDTGRTWQVEGYKVKDVSGTPDEISISTTDELIKLIKTKEHNVYLLIHPNHWLQGKIEGIKWDMLVSIRVFLKKSIIKKKGAKSAKTI